MKRVAASFCSRSEDDTDRLGRLIGHSLASGDVVALAGAMGSGKTRLTRGIASGLGVPEDEPVVSPTFVLVREYTGRLPLLHCDVYRLATASEFADLGVTEAAGETGAVTVIEWADRVAEALPERTWWIECEHAGETERTFALRLPDEDRTRIVYGEIRELSGRP